MTSVWRREAASKKTAKDITRISWSNEITTRIADLFNSSYEEAYVFHT